MANVLNSWKEIAAYLGRGVRTAQRWERDLALPVRRPRGKERSAVFAVPEEIDAWLRECPARALSGDEELTVERRLTQRPMPNGSDRRAPQSWEAVWQMAERVNRNTLLLYKKTLAIQKQMERAIALRQALTLQRTCDYASYRTKLADLRKKLHSSMELNEKMMLARNLRNTADRAAFTGGGGHVHGQLSLQPSSVLELDLMCRHRIIDATALGL